MGIHAALFQLSFFFGMEKKKVVALTWLPFKSRRGYN